MTNEEIKRELIRLENNANHTANECFVLSKEIKELRKSIGEPVPPAILRGIQALGQPSKAQFPSNKWKHRAARSVHDMVLTTNKQNIVLGSGDYEVNTGSYIYRMDRDNRFQLDADLPEESVERFWPYPSGVWNAGIDPQLNDCAVHRRGEIGWRTCRMGGNMFHLIAMAILRSEIYVVAIRNADWRLYHSETLSPVPDDWGIVIPRPDGMRELIDYKGELIVFCSVAESNPIYRFDGTSFTQICAEAFPGETASWKYARKCFNYNDKVVYGCISGPSMTESNRKLYALDPNTGTTEVLWETEDHYVCDFFVDEGDLYIMVFRPLGGNHITAREFRAQVWKTSNLENWLVCANCVFPAVPFSCIKRRESLYIGVGCRGRRGQSPDTVSDVDEESGTVYLLVA